MSIVKTDVNPPLVTVAIPAYNAEDYIQDAVESVLAQDYPNLELLVVDDQSTDSTYALLQQVKDPRLRLEQNAVNLGAEGNWNRCLELAEGKYYLLLPGDDLLYPGSIRERVAVLEDDAEEELALVFCHRRIIDHQGRRVMDTGPVKAGRISRQQLLRKNVVTGMNIIGEPGAGLTRSSLAKRLGSYDAGLPYVIDLDFWVRILAYGDAWCIARPLCAFRITRANWSSRLGGERYRNYRDMIRRIQALPYAGVSPLLARYGIMRAWANERLRRVFYFFFRRG